jgi:hypothetical protein
MFSDGPLPCISMIPTQVSFHSNKFRGVKSEIENNTNLVIYMILFNRKFPQICYVSMQIYPFLYIQERHFFLPSLLVFNISL